MNTTPVVAFIKDDEGRYQYANEPFLKLFQKTFDEVYSKTDLELLPPDAAKTVSAHDRQVLESGTSMEVVEVVPDASGAGYVSIPPPRVT